MGRVGFIHDKLDIKFLILYIASRLIEPVGIDVLTDLALCDEGVDYFSFSECLNELVESEHIKKTEEGFYCATPRGIRNSEICESRLHSPSGKNFAISSPRSEKLSRRSRTDFIRQRYPMESAAVSTWPITVATAAPIMPQWKPKMNSGSRIVFATAPATVAAMANFGLPSERMIGLTAWPNM